MKYPAGELKAAFLLFVLAVSLFVYGCSGRDAVTEKNFVGKWQSSRLATPVYLYANGEWEIKKDDGSVLQYGVWEYNHKNLLWSYRSGPNVLHDPNDVLSVSPLEFKLKERDGTTTTFKKLD